MNSIAMSSIFRYFLCIFACRIHKTGMTFLDYLFEDFVQRVLSYHLLVIPMYVVFEQGADPGFCQGEEASKRINTSGFAGTHAKLSLFWGVLAQKKVGILTPRTPRTPSLDRSLINTQVQAHIKYAF